MDEKDYSDLLLAKINEFPEFPGALKMSGFSLIQDPEHESICYLKKDNYCVQGSFSELRYFLNGYILAGNHVMEILWQDQNTLSE